MKSTGGAPCSMRCSSAAVSSVFVDHVGEAVQPLLAQAGERDRAVRRGLAGEPGDLGEERVPRGVVVEQTVPDRAPRVAAAAATWERLRVPNHLDDTMMDLVRRSRRPRQRLLAGERGCYRQQPQTGRRAARPRPRAGRRSLRRASDSRRRCRAPDDRPRPVPPQHRRDRVDRNHSRSALVAREPGNTTRSASRTSPGLVVKNTLLVGSTASASRSVKLLIRGNRTTAIVSRSTRRGTPYRDVQRVLGVQPQLGQPRQYAVRRAAGDRGEHVDARLQQRDVAAELVHQEPTDQAPDRRRRATRPCRTSTRTLPRDRCRRPRRPAPWCAARGPGSRSPTAAG